MTERNPLISVELLAALQPSAIALTDREYLPKYRERVADAIANSPTTEEFDKRSKWSIRPDLGPIAVDGDANAARVVFLKVNPSYDDDATAITHYQPDPEWPLSVANPAIHFKTRQYYQDGVFLHLRKAGISLEQIAHRMLKVELFPWASKGWPSGDRDLLNHLAQAPSRQLISELVGGLVSRDTIFLIGKGRAEWFQAVPALGPLLNDRVFVSKMSKLPWISQGMYPGGWPDVVARLRS